MSVRYGVMWPGDAEPSAFFDDYWLALAWSMPSHGVGAGSVVRIEAEVSR